MDPIQKVNIPIAANKHCKLDLSCDHATTMAFMRLQPVYYRHMIKGEHLNFDCLAEVRPAPMVVPTYGKMRLNLRGFWVPYRLCFPQWHEFSNDTIGVNYSNSSLVTSPPTVDSTELLKLFTTASYGNATTTTSSSPHDFTAMVSGNLTYFQFTERGRFVYKILYSLGYDLCPDGDGDIVTFNALALLAYFKLYVDWYANSQYLDGINVISIQKLLSYNDPTSNLVLTASVLDPLFGFVRDICYSSNGYFEQAWDNPVAPNANQFSGFNLSDYGQYSQSGGSAYNSVNTLANGTPIMKQSSSSRTELGTTYMHDALKRLTDFQKRHALSGARSIDRVLSQYGITTDYLKIMRSVYVGSQSIDIKSGAVMATAAGTYGNTGSLVGDYAGAGFGSGNKTWDFSCDEEGIFIVCASILPSGGYYQGYDRMNKNISKLDFFTPEMDGLGVQAIEKGEVYVSRNASFCQSADSYGNIFAFTGRYGQYKRPISRVSGDFATSLMVDGDNWHLMRKFSDQYWGTVATISHNQGFTVGDDSATYNRIFYYAKSGIDPFYCFFHFDVGSYAPCRPLMETYEFEDAGKSVSVDSGGSKLN